MFFAVISAAWLLLGGVLSPGTTSAWPAAASGPKRRSGHDYSSAEPTGGDDYQDSSAGNDYSAGSFKKKKTAGHDYSSSEPIGGADYQDSSAGNDYSAGSFKKKKAAGHDYSSTELSGGDDYHHPTGNDYSSGTAGSHKKKKTAGHDYSSSEFAGGTDYQDQSSGEDYAVSGVRFAGEDYAADEGEDYADEGEGEDYADEDEGGADYSGDADPPPFIGRVHDTKFRHSKIWRIFVNFILAF
jgi:hypothetical protein